MLSVVKIFKALEKFLGKVRANPNIKELVIAGDLLDEWYVPADVDTYQGKDQADFVQRIAVANKGVIGELNKIIQEKIFTVTYVPGNHDLTITAENVNLILPGINQGTLTTNWAWDYSPTSMPCMAIENGHRYNFLLCA